MKVRAHTPVDGSKMADDPAEYARGAALVDNHDPWVRDVIGAWRWTVIQKHKDAIKSAVTSGYTIDLGGAAAPVGYGAVVVDYQNPHDEPRSLADVPPDADCVFCSHTLEHFTDVNNAMAAITHKLKMGGKLIVQVPSWQKEFLNAGNWPYHEQTFCLGYETNAPRDHIRLDRFLEGWGYTLEVVDMEQWNILVIARRGR